MPNGLSRQKPVHGLRYRHETLNLKRRIIHPADWGIGMTVCIAAVAEMDTLIMVMDQMLTTGAIATDIRYVKGTRVHPRWFAMAADDTQHVPAILDDVRNLLAKRKGAPTVKTVTDIFLKVYVEHRLRICEQRILKPLSLDLPTFKTMISTNDNETLRKLADKLNAVEFNVQFIVSGFDHLGSPRIFTILPPGEEGGRYEDIGFWSIGSGSGSAVDNLLNRGFAPGIALTGALYEVAESKFLAEKSLGVGARTTIVLMRPDETIAIINRERADSIKAIWANEGQPPPLPAELDERIGPLIKFIKVPPLPKKQQSEKAKKQTNRRTSKHDQSG